MIRVSPFTRFVLYFLSILFFVIIYVKYSTNYSFLEVVTGLLLSAVLPFVGFYETYTGKLPIEYLYYTGASIATIMIGSRFIESYWGDFWMIIGIFSWLIIGYNIHNY